MRFRLAIVVSIEWASVRHGRAAPVSISDVTPPAIETRVFADKFDWLSDVASLAVPMQGLCGFN
jgi:hypothetical protein